MNKEELLSTNGRLRRKDYLIRALVLSISSAILPSTAAASGSAFFAIIASLVSLVCGVLVMIQGVKRLHDIEKSGWYLLICFIPIVNIVWGLYILFKEGTRGPNEYGEDPKAMEADY